MKTALLCLVLAVLAGVACSPASIAAPDGGTSADGGPSGSAIEQICKDYAYARCLRLQTCSPTQIEITYGDVGTCETLFAASCELIQRAPGTASSLTQQQACIAALPGWACSDIIFGENTPPACTSSGGAVADGAPCASNPQCKSAWCRRPHGESCGTCGPLPRVGDACTVAADCGSGLTCAPQTKTCSAHAALGTSCATQPCDDGLTCADGICQATVATAGAPCSTSVGCDLYSGLSCNGASGTCETLTVAPPGDACGVVQNQSQGCKAGSCSHGTCVAYATLGGACDLVAGPACVSVTACITSVDGGTAGTCQIPGTGCF